MRKGGVFGEGDVEPPELVDESKESPDGSRREAAPSPTIVEQPEELRFGQLLAYAARLKAGTAIGMLAGMLGALCTAAVSGWGARGWYEARFGSAGSVAVGGAPAPSLNTSEARAAASQTSPAPTATPSSPATPMPSNKDVAPPACKPPRYPNPSEEQHPYCIEIARGADPDVTAERVFDVARTAQKELGVYWAGNPPAKSNRIMPVNGGAQQLVRVARWYGVSRPVAESVCDFLTCRNWTGSDGRVDKVCEILEKCK